MGKVGGISSKCTVSYSQGRSVNLFIYLFCVRTLSMVPNLKLKFVFTWKLCKKKLLPIILFSGRGTKIANFQTKVINYQKVVNNKKEWLAYASIEHQ